MPRPRHLGFLAVSLLLLCSAAGAATSNYDYNYLISIPSLDGSTDGATFDLQWVGAPLNANGVGYGIVLSPLTGSPQSGYSPYTTAWTTAYDYSTQVQDSEIFLQFADDSGNYLAYTFIEPNSFWATTGTNMNFPVGDPVNALVKWPDSNSDPTGLKMVWGDTKEGAFYGDPTNCSSCTVTTTVTTPEPAGLALLGGGLVGLTGVVRAIRRKVA